MLNATPWRSLAELPAIRRRTFQSINSAEKMIQWSRSSFGTSCFLRGRMRKKRRDWVAQLSDLINLCRIYIYCGRHVQETEAECVCARQLNCWRHVQETEAECVCARQLNSGRLVQETEAECLCARQLNCGRHVQETEAECVCARQLN